ncbi:MAG: BlaI/MecI/CopY family transcriptional regulator [Gammaproteobacteria bacterium]|nr:BlaI/MecI/CopY family transcriptional regulator [Gammaproteobacteria bacterium]
MRLGELEKLTLNYFWGTETADAKQVYAHFKQQRGGTLNTIQSTLDRLYKKGLLVRKKEGHAFQYSAAASRKAFIGQLIRDVTRDFTGDDEDSLLAAFVSLSTELDESQLEKLDRSIQEYRKETNRKQKS